MTHVGALELGQSAQVGWWVNKMDSISPVRANGSLDKGGLWVFQFYRSEAENGQY